jgi:hypothetical protein
LKSKKPTAKSQQPIPPRMHEYSLRGFAPLREKKYGKLVVANVKSKKPTAKSQQPIPPRITLQHQIQTKNPRQLLFG